jgi:hypothetical protein
LSAMHTAGRARARIVMPRSCRRRAFSQNAAVWCPLALLLDALLHSGASITAQRRRGWPAASKRRGQGSGARAPGRSAAEARRGRPGAPGEGGWNRGRAQHGHRRRWGTLQGHGHTDAIPDAVLTDPGVNGSGFPISAGAKPGTRCVLVRSERHARGKAGGKGSGGGSSRVRGSPSGGLPDGNHHYLPAKGGAEGCRTREGSHSTKWLACCRAENNPAKVISLPLRASKGKSAQKVGARPEQASKVQQQAGACLTLSLMVVVRLTPASSGDCSSRQCRHVIESWTLHIGRGAPLRAPRLRRGPLPAWLTRTGEPRALPIQPQTSRGSLSYG